MSKEITHQSTGLSDLAIKATPFHYFPKHINRKREVDDELPFSQNDLDDITKLNGNKVDPSIPPTGKTPEELKAIADAKTASDAEATRIADLAKQHGGVSVDKDGNIIGADGKVVKTAAELNNQSSGDEGKKISIDGVEYILDKDGNAVDNNTGKVAKTKAEIDDIANQDIPVIEELSKLEGIVPTGEDGKPIVYEDSTEGIKQYYKDVNAIRLQEIQKEFLDSIPGLREYVKHKQRGGSDTDYFQKFIKEDWSKVTITDKTSKEEKLNVIKKSFERKGYSAAKADSYVKMIETNGTEDQEAKDALAEMQAADKEARVKEDNDYKLQQEQAQTNAVNYYKNIQTVITTGTIDGIVIPEADKKALYEYIAIAVDDEMRSQEQIDMASETMETRVKNAFLRYKKYNLNSLIQSKVNEQKVRTLTDRLNKNKSHVAGVGGNSNDTPRKGTSIENLTIENITV